MLRRPDPQAIATTVCRLARHPRTRRWGLRFVIFMAVVGVLGFLAVPPLVKMLLADTLGKALHREVSIDSVSLNPYTLTATLSGVSVRDRGDGGEGGGGGKPGDEVLGFDSLRVNTELASLAVAGIVVKEIELVGPRLRLVRLENGRYNVSDLIDEQLAKPPSDGPLPRFSVSNIRMSGGRVEFDDRAEKVKHEVTDIALQIPFVSSLAYYADVDVVPQFSATINGAPLRLDGKSRPFSGTHESELALDLDNLELARYLGYSPVDLPIRLRSGAVDGDLRLRFVQKPGETPTLSLAGNVALKELKVEESGGAPLLAIKRLQLALNDADLLKGVAIDSIVVDSPTVDVRIGQEGKLNWLALLPPPAAKVAPAGKAKDVNGAKGDGKAEANGGAKTDAKGGAKNSVKAAPLQLTVGKLTINDGSVNVADLSTGAEQKAAVKGLHAELRDFDSSGARPTQFSAAWRIDAGEQLRVEEMALRDGRIDLKKRQIEIGEVVSRGARAKIGRDRDGVQWLKPPRLAASAAAPSAPAAGEAPWQFAVARVRVSDQVVQLDDRSVASAAGATIELASLEADNLSSRPDAETKVSARLRVNREGELSVAGTIKPMQPQGELRVDMRAIELLPFQPYFGEYLNVTVTRGQVSAAGTVSLAKNGEALAVGYKGDLTLGNFQSVDKANAADFLRWKSLYFGNIDVATAPLAVSVGEVALADFFARVIVSPQGKLNLLQIVRRDDQPAQPAPSTPSAQPATEPRPVVAGGGKAVAPVPDKPAKDVLPLKIGKVTLQGGNINFSDNFVKPNYSARLTRVGGRVTGLSSAAGSLADLELRGSYDGLAPISITAKLNPLAAKSYLDLNAEVRGVELTSLSTYAAKYAGYAIERGKLSLFLKYKIDNNVLVADNRVFLDQLTFGDPVESPQATKLPVLLAVSLLQNRRGEIDINLPISGSLDDPEFSLGGIIIRVIGNLFVKAVTSPFALLGSLFGGGEELAYVEFDYGYTTLTPAMRERLQTLAKALADRPSLRIELAGRIDPERDREGLKHAQMERRVKAQLRDDLAKQGKEAGSLEDLEVSAKDYPRYLERAYRAEKFPKPRNLVGFVKELPVEEMEKLMLANMPSDDDAMLDLANRRARRVGRWLTDEGKIESERVFFLQPNLTAKEGPQNEQARQSRVDFVLH